MSKGKVQIKSKVEMLRTFWILDFDIHLAFGFGHGHLEIRLEELKEIV